MLINPDIKFKKELQKISKSSLNECMQCGTCSVVCSLAPEERPFPRKEMIWAGWGMKDKLIGNVDVWLCHQCGDCSSHCPRGVKPADVIASVRQMSYMHYAKPKFFGKMLNNPRLLPIAILIPVVLILAMLYQSETFPTLPEGDINYSKFYPHKWLNSSFATLSIIIYGIALFGMRKFWKDMKSHFPDVSLVKGFISGFIGLFGSIMTHNKFSKCNKQRSRKFAHLLVFYGFILLLLVTVYAIVAVAMKTYPIDFYHPFKILGNIAALMLFVGLTIMIKNRLFNKEEFGNSNYSDWLFLITMYLLSISGVLVEWARYDNWSIAYHIYFFHLVCVWFIVIFLPYTKFGHLIFRSFALAFAKTIGRK